MNYQKAFESTKASLEAIVDPGAQFTDEEKQVAQMVLAYMKSLETIKAGESE